MNNIEYDDPQQIAEIFNNFFADIATNLDNNLPESTTNPLALPIKNNYASLYLYPTTASEIKTHIKELKLTKQPRDTLPIKILKENSDILSPIL